MNAGEIHVLRDPTRGGLATSLVEISEQSNVTIELDETSLPETRCKSRLRNAWI